MRKKKTLGGMENWGHQSLW